MSLRDMLMTRYVEMAERMFEDSDTDGAFYILFCGEYATDYFLN